MSTDNHDHFDSDEFDSPKFTKLEKPQRFNVADKDRKGNWRDKRRTKEQAKNKFFER